MTDATLELVLALWGALGWLIVALISLRRDEGRR